MAELSTNHNYIIGDFRIDILISSHLINLHLTTLQIFPYSEEGTNKSTFSLQKKLLVSVSVSAIFLVHLQLLF